jgi:chorismate dehydratase
MRIAASTYLNSAPLVYSFIRGELRNRYKFTGDAAPSQCAALLANRLSDVALIPVIEYQRIPGLLIIPDIAVASKNRVRSVLLAARRPLDEVRRVALDASSRTSQTLVKILFLRRYGLLPDFMESIPDPSINCENMLESSDAALIIGDPAMRLEASAHKLGLRIYDLAAEWRAMTGLPFVFAIWAVHEGLVRDWTNLVQDLIAAKEEGLKLCEQIASQYADELNLPAVDLLSYLRENVNYDLDDDNIDGMLQYFNLAYEYGLIPKIRGLRFAR